MLFLLVHDRTFIRFQVSVKLTQFNGIIFDVIMFNVTIASTNSGRSDKTSVLVDWLVDIHDCDITPKSQSSAFEREI